MLCAIIGIVQAASGRPSTACLSRLAGSSDAALGEVFVTKERGSVWWAIELDYMAQKARLITPLQADAAIEVSADSGVTWLQDLSVCSDAFSPTASLEAKIAKLGGTPEKTEPKNLAPSEHSPSSGKIRNRPGSKQYKWRVEDEGEGRSWQLGSYEVTIFMLSHEQADHNSAGERDNAHLLISFVLHVAHDCQGELTNELAVSDRFQALPAQNGESMTFRWASSRHHFETNSVQEGDVTQRDAASGAVSKSFGTTSECAATQNWRRPARSIALFKDARHSSLATITWQQPCDIWVTLGPNLRIAPAPDQAHESVQVSLFLEVDDQIFQHCFTGHILIQDGAITRMNQFYAPNSAAEGASIESRLQLGAIEAVRPERRSLQGQGQNAATPGSCDLDMTGYVDIHSEISYTTQQSWHTRKIAMIDDPCGENAGYVWITKDLLTDDPTLLTVNWDVQDDNTSSIKVAFLGWKPGIGYWTLEGSYNGAVTYELRVKVQHKQDGCFKPCDTNPNCCIAYVMNIYTFIFTWESIAELTPYAQIYMNSDLTIALPKLEQVVPLDMQRLTVMTDAQFTSNNCIHSQSWRNCYGNDPSEVPAGDFVLFTASDGSDYTVDDLFTLDMSSDVNKITVHKDISERRAIRKYQVVHVIMDEYQKIQYVQNWALTIEDVCTDAYASLVETPMIYGDNQITSSTENIHLMKELTLVLNDISVHGDAISSFDLRYSMVCGPLTYTVTSQTPADPAIDVEASTGLFSVYNSMLPSFSETTSTIVTFHFNYVWTPNSDGDAVATLTLATAAADSLGEIVLGECDSPELVAEGVKYFEQDDVPFVRLTREMFKKWVVPEDIFTFSTNGAGDSCGGMYELTDLKLFSENQLPGSDVTPGQGAHYHELQIVKTVDAAEVGEFVAPFEFALTANAEMNALRGEIVSVEVSAKWQIGMAQPAVTKSYKFVNFEIYSLFNADELELILEPLRNLTFVVDQKYDKRENIFCLRHNHVGVDTSPCDGNFIDKNVDKRIAFVDVFFIFIKPQYDLLPYPYLMQEYASDFSGLSGDPYILGGSYDRTKQLGHLTAAKLENQDWLQVQIEIVCEKWHRDYHDTLVDDFQTVYNTEVKALSFTLETQCYYAKCDNREAWRLNYLMKPFDPTKRLVLSAFNSLPEVDYLVHKGLIVIDLPVVTAFCYAERIQVLEEALQFDQNGDKSQVTLRSLESQGIKIVSANTTAVVEVDNDDERIYGKTFALRLRSTIEGEPEYYNTTVVWINMLRPPCEVTVAEIEAVTVPPIKLFAFELIGVHEYSTVEIIKVAERAFRMTEKTYCGVLDYELDAPVSESAFLELDKDNMQLVLRPDKPVELGIYQESSLKFFFPEYPDRVMYIPVSSEITVCQLLSASFQEQEMVQEIIIGEEAQEIELPVLELEPACDFEEIKFSSVTLSPLGSLPEERPLSQFILYDPEIKSFVALNQTDFSLIGQEVVANVTVKIERTAVQANLIIKLVITAEGPWILESEEKKAAEPAITCSEQDFSMSMPIPGLAFESQQQIEFNIVYDDEFSKMFEIKGRNVQLRKNYARMIAKGKMCPSALNNVLKIEAKSDLLGTSIFEFNFATKVAQDTSGRAWQPQFVAFDSGIVLEEVYAESNGEEFTLPYIELESVDNNGLITFKFSEPMSVPQQLEKLKSKKLEINGQERSVFEVRVEPIDELGQTPEQVALDWSVASFTATELKIQVEFAMPIEISSKSEANFIEIDVWQSRDFFERQKDGFLVPVPAKFSSKLPSMLVKGQAENVSSAATFVSGVGKSTLWIVGLGSLFLRFAMQNILTQVRSLSTITHFMIMSLQYPAIITQFYSSIFEYVTFDIVPSDTVYEQFLVLDDEPYSDQAAEIGYESVYLIPNSGSITIFMVLLALRTFAYAILSRVLARFKFSGFFRRTNESFVWAGALDFFNEAFINLSFSFFINTSSVGVDSASTWVNNVYALAVGVALIVLPITTIYQFLKQVKTTAKDVFEGGEADEEHGDQPPGEHPRDILAKALIDIEREKREVKADESYGSIVKRIRASNLLSRRAAAWLILLLFYRRLAAAGVILALWDYPLAQVALSMANQLFFTVNVAYFTMYRDPSEQRTELVNEIVSLLTLYFLSAFLGDFVSDASAQNEIGIGMIGLTVLNFLLNSVPIIFQIKTFCKLRYTRCRQREAHQLSLLERQKKLWEQRYLVDEDLLPEAPVTPGSALEGVRSAAATGADYNSNNVGQSGFWLQATTTAKKMKTKKRKRRNHRRNRSSIVGGPQDKNKLLEGMQEEEKEQAVNRPGIPVRYRGAACVEHAGGWASGADDGELRRNHLIAMIQQAPANHKFNYEVSSSSSSYSDGDADISDQESGVNQRDNSLLVISEASEQNELESLRSENSFKINRKDDQLINHPNAAGMNTLRMIDTSGDPARGRQAAFGSMSGLQQNDQTMRQTQFQSKQTQITSIGSLVDPVSLNSGDLSQITPTQSPPRGRLSRMADDTTGRNSGLIEAKHQSTAGKGSNLTISQIDEKVNAWIKQVDAQLWEKFNSALAAFEAFSLDGKDREAELLKAGEMEQEARQEERSKLTKHMDESSVQLEEFRALVEKMQGMYRVSNHEASEHDLKLSAFADKYDIQPRPPIPSR